MKGKSINLMEDKEDWREVNNGHLFSNMLFRKFGMGCDERFEEVILISLRECNGLI